LFIVKNSVRKDHRPFLIKYYCSRINNWYVRRFVQPQFEQLGIHPMIIKPHTCEIHGKGISAGNYLHLISHRTKPVRLTTWSGRQGQGLIDIGDYCLIAPGVEITAAQSIRIGANTMIAAECSINDCDWHGLYNRTRPFRCSQPVTLGDNVWLGARVIVCKGVTIGDNSVIGAGSVVTSDIPANVVAAGNPARVVKELNPRRRMLKREFLFRKGDFYWQNQKQLDKYLTAGNSLWKWLNVLTGPSRQD
jgi:acetyltransferase-like isoleucine patch superfamily enzyme